MYMIEIVALDNGAHRNQSYHGNLPEGWAVIPEGMETPNFPFGEVEVDYSGEYPVVTKWTPGEMPEPEPIPEPDPGEDASLEERMTTVENDVAALTAAVERGLSL